MALMIAPCVPNMQHDGCTFDVKAYDYLDTLMVGFPKHCTCINLTLILSHTWHDPLSALSMQLTCVIIDSNAMPRNLSCLLIFTMLLETIMHKSEGQL